MEKGEGGMEREAGGGEGQRKENAGVGGQGKEGRDGVENKRVWWTKRQRASEKQELGG